MDSNKDGFCISEYFGGSKTKKNHEKMHSK